MSTGAGAGRDNNAERSYDGESEAYEESLQPGERPWRFTQWFRKMQSDEDQAPRANGQSAQAAIEDVNFITSVEFDDSGEFLATGDKSGNIVVLQNAADKANERTELVHYGFFSEFQSHHIEFDFVRSVQVDERINQIKWGPKTNDSILLLATNDKQIKLWKVSEREPMHFVNWNLPERKSVLSPTGQPLDLPPLSLKKKILTDLKVPKVIKEPSSTITSLKKQYSMDAHNNNITNLAMAPDYQNFLSGDNYKINLWDITRVETSFNIVDNEIFNRPDMHEIISTIDYHPTNPTMFLYGTNAGNMRICDMRSRALADSPAKVFTTFKRDRPLGQQQLAGGMTAANIGVAGMNSAAAGVSNPLEDHQDQQSLFDEVTSGVSAAKFSRGGRFIISRDYMSVKIWDLNYEKKPVETIYVHEFLRERLFELYQSELLWDCFSLGVSSRGDIVTGSYSNYFHVFDLGEKQDIFIQASKAPEKITDLELHNRKRQVAYANPGMPGAKNKKNGTAGAGAFSFARLFGGSKKKEAPKVGGVKGPNDDYPHKFEFPSIEFNKKILDCSWHPDLNVVAVAGQNNLFVYSK